MVSFLLCAKVSTYMSNSLVKGIKSDILMCMNDDMSSAVAQYLKQNFPKTFSEFVKESEIPEVIPSSIFTKRDLQEAGPVKGDAPPTRAPWQLSLADQLLYNLAPSANVEDAFAQQWESCGHVNSVFCLACDRTSRLVISGSDDETVKVWSLPMMTMVAELKQLRSQVLNISVHPSNSCFAVSSSGGKICVFGMSDFKLVNTILLSGVSSAVFSTTGKYLVGYAHNEALFWSYEGVMKSRHTPFAKHESRFAIASPDSDDILMVCAFSPGDEFFAFATANGVTGVVALSECFPSKTFSVNEGEIDSIRFANHSCGSFFTLSDTETSVTLFCSNIRMFDTVIPLGPHHDMTTCAAFTANDQKIIIMCQHSMHAFCTLTHVMLYTVALDYTGWLVVAHPILSNICACAYLNGVVAIVNSDTGEVTRRLECMSGVSPLDILFSDDGQYLILSDASGRVVTHGPSSPPLESIPTAVPYTPIPNEKPFVAAFDSNQESLATVFSALRACDPIRTRTRV